MDITELLFAAPLVDSLVSPLFHKKNTSSQDLASMAYNPSGGEASWEREFDDGNLLLNGAGDEADNGPSSPALTENSAKRHGGYTGVSSYAALAPGAEANFQAHTARLREASQEPIISDDEVPT